jgi:hypothetical protein
MRLLRATAEVVRGLRLPYLVTAAKASGQTGRGRHHWADWIDDRPPTGCGYGSAVQRNRRKRLPVPPRQCETARSKQQVIAILHLTLSCRKIQNGRPSMERLLLKNQNSS